MHKRVDSTDTDVSIDSADEDFEALAIEQGLIAEFWEYVLENRKFWMIPILMVLVILGVLIALGGTVIAPLIYPLF